MTKQEDRTVWIENFEEKMGYLPRYEDLPEKLKDEETTETKLYYHPVRKKMFQNEI